MWIRSQDGKYLGDCKRLHIEKCGNSYRIINQVFYQAKAVDHDMLGTYEMEERAVEVLDEIQKALIENLSYGMTSNNKIYQMPKEQP